MKKNNFEELEQMHLFNAKELPEEVRENILNSKKMFSFFGNIVHLFIPKLFEFIGMLLTPDNKSLKDKQKIK